jgi:prepilin-type N-terminal cleavage/methylation domain-containing protein
MERKKEKKMQAIIKKQLKQKKGFTLVEVIVVLVILAILAAIGIPALTGYISDANDRALLSEARTVAMALQTTITTYTAQRDPLPTTNAAWETEVNRLAGTNYNSEISNVALATGSSTRLGAFKLTIGNRVVTYNDGDYIPSTTP